MTMGPSESVPPTADLHGKSGIAHRANPWQVALSLAWREMVRFLRQPNRVVGAVGQPIVFWLLFGIGMNPMFRVEEQSFQEYFFAGSLWLILLFTAIFATISIIEDRREGFLQGILVAPVPRWAMVLGKVLGTSTLATLQGAVFLTLGIIFLGIRLGPVDWLGLMGLMFLTSWSFTSLGFWIAWRMESTQGFHAIMNLLLMPMWLLSGAFFPIARFSAELSIPEQVMHGLMRLNPVTYSLGAAQHLLGRHTGNPLYWQPTLGWSWLLTGLFAAIMFGVASRVARQTTRGDLQ